MGTTALHTKFDTLPMPTDADFSSSKYRVVICDGSDTDVAADATAPYSGVLTNSVKDYSSDSNAKVDVAVDGRVRCIAGAAIAMNAPVMATTGGKVITATDGKYVLGNCLTTPAADGDECLVQIAQSYLETT